VKIVWLVEAAIEERGRGLSALGDREVQLQQAFLAARKFISSRPRGSSHRVIAAVVPSWSGRSHFFVPSRLRAVASSCRRVFVVASF